jgi:hypothetical protein
MHAEQIQNRSFLFNGFKINLEEVNIELQKHEDKTTTIKDMKIRLTSD